MKKTTKLVLMSVLTIAMCVSLIAGATFALFTDDDSVSIVVKSGRVDVSAEIETKSLVTYSYDANTDEELDHLWGGTAKFDADGNLEITNMVPYDGVKFDVNIINNSTVEIKWQVKVTCDGEIMDNLDVDISLEGEEKIALTKSGSTLTSDWQKGLEDDTVLHVTLEMPEDVTDQEQDGIISVTVYAVQGNGIYPAYVSDAESLATALNSSDDAPIVLTDDITVSDWTSIPSFNGTLDGNDHTISGLDNALINDLQGGTVKNLTIDATLSKASAGVGSLANKATGTLAIDNVTIEGEIENTNLKTGGMIGEIYDAKDVSNPTNITITNSKNNATVTGTSYYTGGLIGAINGSATKVEITDCTNYGTIHGDKHAGGLVGFTSGQTIYTNCTNYGNVSENFGAGAGGITGFASATSTQNTDYDYYGPTFVNCTNYGEISNASGKATIRTGHIVGGFGIEGGGSRCDVTITLNNCGYAENATVTNVNEDYEGLVGGQFDESNKYDQVFTAIIND